MTTSPSTAGSARPIDPQVMKRAVRGTFVGNLMEWYDVGVFGYLIVTMGPVFLPDASPAAQVLFMLGAFASTYVFRPLGGIFFGWLGDRIGRQRVLFITLSMVVLATFTIGLLPGYATIGMAAVVLLVLLKVLQGFSAGGELTGALTFIAEHAPDKRRGFFCAFLDAGSFLGFSAGATVVTLMQLGFGQQAMQDGLWRIPFLIAGPIGLAAIYMRLKVEESPLFAELHEQRIAGLRKPSNPLSTLRANWLPMLQTVILVAAANTAGYAFTSYMPTYLAGLGNLDATSSNLLGVPVLILMALSMPFIGMLSDRVGRKPVLWVGSIWTVVCSVPAFMLLSSGNIPLVVCGLVLIGLPVALYMGALAATLPALFPTDQRNSALGMSYNVSVAVFGGTAPIIIESIIRSTGSHLAAGFYLALMALLGIIAVKGIKESAGRPLLQSHTAPILPAQKTTISNQAATQL
jgi:MFS transporter, MHS family, proline/betaine transporter